MTDTNVHGYVVTSGGFYHIYKVSLTDGTAAEVQCKDISGAAISLGKIAQGETLLEIHPQLATGSILAQMYVKTGTGAIRGKWIGCERTSNQRSNCAVTGLNVRIDEGMQLWMLTAD